MGKSLKYLGIFTNAYFYILFYLLFSFFLAKLAMSTNKDMTLTMLLASSDVLGPVAGVSLLVVEEAADAELLSGGAVPAGPVAGAGGLVPEDAVEPVAVLGGDGWV